MKKLIFISLAVLMSYSCAGQLEDQLPLKSPSLATDTIRVVKDGESALMLRSTLLSDIEDTTSSHLTRIESLEGNSDSAWASINTDIISGYTDNGADIVFNHDEAGYVGLDYTTASLEYLISTGGTNPPRMYARDISINNQSTISVGTGGISIIYDTTGVGAKTMSFSPSSMLITDSHDSIGLEYAADYSTAGGILGDRWIPDKGYVDGVAGTNYWSRSGTQVSLLNAGDSILLATDEKLQFGDGTAAIYETGPGNGLTFDADGTTVIRAASGNVSLYTDLSPTSSGVHDIGSSSNFWDNSYFDSIFISNATTTIGKDASHNITLTDAVTGTKTLAELAAGGSYTFSQGLTEAAGVVTLGGSITNVRTITGSGETVGVIIQNDSPGGFESSRVSFNQSGAQLSAYNDDGYVTTSGYDQLTLSGTGATFLHTDGTDLMSMYMSNASMLITDAINSKGLQYAADYSINFTDRSLVDRGYMNQAISDSIDALLAAGEPGVALADSSGVVAGSYVTGWDFSQRTISDLGITATTAEVNYTTDVTSNIQAQLDDKIDKEYPSINAQTGTAYTFVLTDGDNFITLSNAAAITATVPPNSSVAYSVGTTIDCAQIGAGTVTFAEGSGVTINSLGSDLISAGQYAAFTLIKIATDTWLLKGDL